MPQCNWRQKTSVFCFSACSVTQSCSILWDPLDYSLPGSSVDAISQARILERVAISSCRGSFPSRNSTQISCVSCIGRWILLEPSEKPLIAFVHKWYLDRIYHLRIMLSSKKLFTTFRYCIDMLNLKPSLCKKYVQWQKLINKLETMMGWCEYRISRYRNTHRIHRELTLSAFTSI